jgi:hypothetical protein
VQVLSEGQQVKHEVYGLGVVMESDTDRTTVEFDDHGMKKFVTTIWTAEVLGQAPPRPARRRQRRARKVVPPPAPK